MSVRISNNTLEVYNPATGEGLENLRITSLGELESITATGKNAAKAYNFSSFAQRREFLKMFRKGIIRRMDEFIETICNETGKKPFEGLMEVFTSVDHLNESSRLLKSALGRDKRRVGVLISKKAWVEYEPIGVAGIISPWNYPLILTLTPVAEALLAGNAVVLKPSEQTPLTTKLLKEVWDESTGQPELFQVVYGSGEIGHGLVISRNTDVICFTGSTAVGRKIAEACAPLFKPVILELGGKDPMIILEDADLPRTVEAALWGGLSNAGQTCISVERIYAQEKIYPQLVERLSAEIKNMKSGRNNSPIGAISVDVSLEKIRNQIADAENKAEVVQGTADEGNFIPPTLVVNPPADAEILREETFGPVMTISPFKSDEDAAALANSTGYGLSASVFGRNKKRIKTISRKIQAGAVTINDVMTHYGIADLPFGGLGLSGMGRVHGREGLRAFSRQKSYLGNRINLGSEYWWFKKSDKFGGILKKIMKWKYS